MNRSPVNKNNLGCSVIFKGAEGFWPPIIWEQLPDVPLLEIIVMFQGLDLMCAYTFGTGELLILGKRSPTFLVFKDLFSFHIWFILSQPTGADVLTQLGKHGEKLIIKATSVAVRMVLINRKALWVPRCVHFKMLVVHWDGSQMRHYLSQAEMQLWHMLFKEDRREGFGASDSVWIRNYFMSDVGQLVCW